MVDHRLLTEALSEFARTLVGRFAVSEVLHDLSRRVVGVLELDGAGVSLHDGTRLRFVTALDERTAGLEQVQEREQLGPCVDAWRSGEVVAVQEVAHVRRWGAYRDAAVAAGVVAVAGLPMHRDGEPIGALDLYCGGRRPWDDDDIAAARLLADVATSYVVNASELDRQRRLAEQLQAALDSRVIIEQAKGMLAADRGIGVDDAFDRLRRQARNTNATLRAVADALVNHGLRP